MSGQMPTNLARRVIQGILLVVIMSVIFTDDESTWSLNGYIAMGLKY